MFGYASDDTPSLMPLPVWLAHRLAERLAAVRRDGTVPGLRPDGKTQVTVGYDGDRAVTLDTVVLSTQHDPDVRQDELHRQVAAQVVAPVLDAAGLDLDVRATRLFVNPTGTFVVGGPQGDAGLTGRKIIVDTYGGMARHGGGAFSGKDPSKVDRSAAYATRWVAKNVVAAGLARRCEVQVAYAIGKAHPVGLYVETFGTEKVPVERITAAIREVFDLRPAAIIRDLDLLRPIYAPTAAYGHFGRELEQFTWSARTASRTCSPRCEERRRAADGCAARDGGAWFDGVVSEPEDTSRAVQDTLLTVAPAAPRRGPAPPASHEIAARLPVARLALDLAPAPGPRVRLTSSPPRCPTTRARGCGSGAVRGPGRRRLRPERVDRSDHDGRLLPLRRVVSAEPVLAPAVARLARARSRTTTRARSPTCCASPCRRGTRGPSSPSRHGRARAVPAPGTALARSPRPQGPRAWTWSPPRRLLQPFPSPSPCPRRRPPLRRARRTRSPCGPRTGPAPRSSRTSRAAGHPGRVDRPPGLAPPAPEVAPEVASAGRRGAGRSRKEPDALPVTHWAAAVAEAVRAARSGGRGALVVVPDARDVDQVCAALAAAGLPAWDPATGARWCG